MRKPTSKELFLMRSTLEGLQQDLEALESLPYDVSYADVLGTMYVNLTLLSKLHKALRDETVSPETVDEQLQADQELKEELAVRAALLASEAPVPLDEALKTLDKHPIQPSRMLMSKRTEHEVATWLSEQGTMPRLSASMGEHIRDMIGTCSWVVPKMEWWTRLTQEDLVGAEPWLPFAMRVERVILVGGGKLRYFVLPPDGLRDKLPDYLRDGCSIHEDLVFRTLQRPHFPAPTYMATKPTRVKLSEDSLQVTYDEFTATTLDAESTAGISIIGMVMKGKMVLAYSSEEEAREQAKASKKLYGWSMFIPHSNPVFRWFTGTEEELSTLGVTAALDPNQQGSMEATEEPPRTRMPTGVSIGMGVANLRGIKKLELYSTDPLVRAAREILFPNGDLEHGCGSEELGKLVNLFMPEKQDGSQESNDSTTEA